MYVPESVEEIQKKIQWIEQSIQGKTPLYDLLASRKAKQQLILLWAGYLEDLAKAGIYQKPIFTISTHITNRLKELDIDNSWSYVRKSLPFKYKDSSYNHSSTEERDTDYHDISSFRLENKKLIKLCDDTAEVLEGISDKLANTAFISKLSKEQKQNQDEYFLKWRNMLSSLKQVADERNEVVHSKQFLFLYSRTISTLGNTYGTFIKYLREFGEISTKQAGKILNGKSSYLDAMYEPKNRLEARDIGFFGFPCEHCGSFRVEVVFHPDLEDIGKDEAYCYKCQSWSELQTIKLPTS